jgi:adenosylhomocysteine nucleosidase
VLAAIPEEISSLRRRLGARRSTLAGRTVWRAGGEGETEVVLAVGGDGAARAGRSASEILDALDADLLLGIGAAGALTADLEPGDLLVARTIRDADGEAPAPDAAWSERALRHPGAVAGLLWSSARLVRTREQRRACLTASGAAVPAAADLESAAWARAAARTRTPCLVIRAISDSAAEDLPEVLGRSERPGGGISRAGVALRALVDPAVIPRLLRLRGRVLDGGRRLAAAAEELLALRSGGTGRRIAARRTTP